MSARLFARLALCSHVVSLGCSFVFFVLSCCGLTCESRPVAQVRYYQLTVAPSSADLTFACTTFAGSASMFISNTEQPKPSNTSTFQWSAPYYQPNKRVTINLAQPGLVRVDGMLRCDSCLAFLSFAFQFAGFGAVFDSHWSHLSSFPRLSLSQA